MHTAIGWVSCPQRYRYEAPRQGTYGFANRATITLHEGMGFESALQGLEQFERIWVLFEFHLNETWHPLVQPPRADMAKVGVFASRSPHRPSRIGMSCVELVAVEGRCLQVQNHDLLDQTPVLDIKPYIPYADAFPDAQAGWLDNVEQKTYDVVLTAKSAEKAKWVQQNAGLDVVNFAKVQLSFDPRDARRKRISESGENQHIIAYRTWRLLYEIDEAAAGVQVCDLWSGYTDQELAESGDRYGDKDAHRRFNCHFGRHEA